MSQKFKYIRNLERLVNMYVDSEDHVNLRNLNKSINVYNSPVSGDHLISLREFRDMGYKELKIDQHVLIDETNLELICFQYESIDFRPDIRELCKTFSQIVSDIGECRATINFNAVTLGDVPIMERELKDLEDLYYDFNRHARRILHANQILTYMAN